MVTAHTQAACVDHHHGSYLSTEIESQMSDLREQFKQDSLPIDDDLLTFDLDEATHAAHATSASFVSLRSSLLAKDALPLLFETTIERSSNVLDGFETI